MVARFEDRFGPRCENLWNDSSKDVQVKFRVKSVCGLGLTLDDTSSFTTVESIDMAKFPETFCGSHKATQSF